MNAVARSTYRAGSAAHRANRRQRWAVSMTYAARPLNADDAAELAARDADLARIGVVPPPAGFDTPEPSVLGQPSVPMTFHVRALNRRRLACAIRAARAEVARRATELTWLAAHLGCTVPEIPRYEHPLYARSAIATLRDLQWEAAAMARALGRRSVGWRQYIEAERQVRA